MSKNLHIFWELRFDEDWMRDELNKERLMEYAERIGSNALTRRVKLLLKAYDVINV
jgi:hypothetical protein